LRLLIYLKKQNSYVDGIVTSDLPSNIKMNEKGFTIKDCILSLDKETKNYAISLFRKYPFDNFYEIKDEYYNNFYFKVNEKKIDAIYLSIVGYENGILFTLPIIKEFKNNFLTLNSDDNSKIKVLNLYGKKENSEFIINYISKQIQNTLPNFEKFISIIGNCKYSDKFEKSFKELPLNAQENVIIFFQKAIDRNGNTKFYADDDLIKDVTPSSSKYKTYELRIFKPMALRIYFNESSNFTYLASIEKKPNPKVQNNDIITANIEIKQFFKEIIK